MAYIVVISPAIALVVLCFAAFVSMISYRGNWQRLGDTARSQANSAELVGISLPDAESLAFVTQASIGNFVNAQVTPLLV